MLVWFYWQFAWLHKAVFGIERILTEIDLLLVHFERLSDHIFDAFHMLCIWKTLHLNFLNFLFDFL